MRRALCLGRGANPKQTLHQQGYSTKEKVHDALEGFDITAGPLAIYVDGKEARVSVVMRSMKDPGVKEVCAALLRRGIFMTSGEMEDMKSGFILHKDFPWHGIARVLSEHLPPRARRSSWPRTATTRAVGTSLSRTRS